MTVEQFDTMENTKCSFLAIDPVGPGVKKILDQKTTEIDSVIRQVAEKREIDSTYFVAVGGSHGSLFTGNYLLQRKSKKNSYLFNANDFIYKDLMTLGSNSIVILASHSGNTPEVVEAAKHAKQKGAFVVTIGGNESGTFHSTSDYRCVYDVKNVPTAVSVIGYLISIAILRHVDGNQVEATERERELRELPDLLNSIKAKSREMARTAVTRFDRVQQLYVAGNGILTGYAYQLAIIGLHEFARVTATPIDLGDFFHGPLERMEPEQHMLLFVDVNEKSRALCERIEQFGKKVGVDLLVVDAKELTPNASEYVTPIIMFFFSRWFTFYMAMVRGHNPDDKRYMGVMDY